MMEKISLWEHLTETDKPIFLYGTGNGGDKIIAALERYGVQLTGIFASDGFVRDRFFHAIKVRSYSDVIAEYGNDIIILLAFGTTLPNVQAFISQLNERHELIIPDVPLYGGELFDMVYYNAHREILTQTEELFADEESRQLFRDVINFRLSGKIKYLARTECITETLNKLFADRSFDTILDGGAFKGDSTALFAEALTPKRIIAVEADPKTYKKLEIYAANEHRTSVTPIHAALWNTDGELEYISSGSRGSGRDGRNHRSKNAAVPCRTIDSIIDGESVDMLKLDIEGAEDRAIDGAAVTIKRYQPDMMISMYHRTDDLFTIPQRLHRLLPYHSLFLRRIPCIPMWDLTLYALRK